MIAGVLVLAVVIPLVAFSFVGYVLAGRMNQFATLALAQLTQIHQLVNSDMTATRQELLDQTEVTLLMLRRVVADARAVGDRPTDEDLAAVHKTEKRIEAMRGVLADRLAAQMVVEQEQREAADAQERLTESA